MNPLANQLTAEVMSWSYYARSRWEDERGEGVISMAIAVLIVAFIGAAAFVLFRDLLSGAGSKASTQVNNIGN
jgi:hypothetical protein